MKLRALALLLSASLLPCQALATEVATNAPSLAASTFNRVDENGVDLISGRFIFKGPRLRAGAAPREADFALTWNGSMWSFPTPSIWQDADRDMFVGIGASTDELKRPQYGAADKWYSYINGVSKLECLLITNWDRPADISYCTYQGGDGAGGMFLFAPYDSDPPNFLLPNGNIKAHHVEWCSAQGVCSKSIIQEDGKQEIQIDGWAIKFYGLYSTTATATLYSGDTEVDRITIQTPSASHDDRYDDSVIAPEDAIQTMTEADGSVWKFTFSSAQNMTGVRRPGSSSNDISIGYNSDDRVTSLTNALGTWRYDYSTVNDDLKKTVVTKPDGSTYSVTYIRKKGNIRSHTDELGRTTTYNYSDYGNILETIFPEGNRTTYEYGTRGKLVKTNQYPKPTRPNDPVLVTRAEYLDPCTNSGNCSYPSAIIDANGNRTEYTYSGGFVATETKPSPNGTDPRPQVRWTYGSVQPRVLNSSGTLVTLAAKAVPLEKSECLTAASCAGTADEVRTLFDYGPASGPNPGYLRGVTVVHNGQARRTCYDYDALGNRIAERKPRANLAGCYSDSSSFAVSDASATEGGSLLFTVTKSGSSSTNLTVNYATSNGSATAGSDYNASSGTLTFAPTDTTKTVTVATIDDAVLEGAETLTVTLSNPSGGAALGDGSGQGTINDNDGGGGTGCNGVSFRVNDDADDEGNPLVFTITKSGTTSASCSVSYASANGTAISPGDYAAVSGTLTFGPSETTKTVSITTTTTGPGEGTETMYLNLTSPTGGATIIDTQGVGTIYNYFYDDGGCPLC